MKRTTKDKWTDYGIIISSAVLASMLLATVSYYFRYSLTDIFFSPVPSTLLRGMDTVMAIEIFGGNSVFTPDFISDQYIPWMIVSAISLIASLFLIPWFYMKGLEAIEEGKRNWIYYTSGALMVLLIGSQLVVTSKLMVNSFGFISTSNKASVEKSREIDRARAYLTDIAFEAAEKMITEKGFSISEFNEFSNMDTDRFDVEVNKDASDSTLVLHLVLANVPDDADRKNINGQTGKKELTVEVDPASDNFFRFRN